MKEEWRSLKGLVPCGDYYEVSNLGRVRSTARNKLKLRKLIKGTDEYLQVRLHLNKEQHLYGVHRLVAIAFIPKPNDTDVFEVNHIDKNRQNNVVTNLEWLSHTANTQYSNNKKVRCYTYPEMTFVGEFESIKIAGEELKIWRQDISKVCKGKLRQTKGYYFEYVD